METTNRTERVVEERGEVAAKAAARPTTEKFKQAVLRVLQPQDLGIQRIMCG